MKVLALNRTISENAEDPLIEQFYGLGDLKEMLSRCDYVAITLPLTGQTRGLIGGAEFAVMKTSVVIINVGRGPTIDERGLIEALSKKTIRGAALDVFDQEPLPPGHAFYSFENVLLSPHCADHTPNWHEDAMRFFLEQLERYRRGADLLNVVDKKRGY
jgi:phosphoglycerate dehydrogenase-like enzyme